MQDFACAVPGPNGKLYRAPNQSGETGQIPGTGLREMMYGFVTSVQSDEMAGERFDFRKPIALQFAAEAA